MGICTFNFDGISLVKIIFCRQTTCIAVRALTAQPTRSTPTTRRRRRPWTRAWFRGPWVAKAGALDSPTESSKLFDFFAPRGTSPSTSGPPRSEVRELGSEVEVRGRKQPLKLRRPWTWALFRGPWVALVGALDSLNASSGVFDFSVPRGTSPSTSDLRGPRSDP